MITVEFKSTAKDNIKKELEPTDNVETVEQETNETTEEGTEELEELNLNNNEVGDPKVLVAENIQDEGSLSHIVISEHAISETSEKPEHSVENAAHNVVTVRSGGSMSKSKPEFCVKVTPPQKYVTVNLSSGMQFQPSVSNGLVNQGLPTHFLQSSGGANNIQGIITSQNYQPITIIEAQPINMSLPVHVASVDSVNVGESLPLQMTSINGVTGVETLSSHVTNLGNVSVQELVPVQIMPADDGESMETHVVVSSGGTVEQNYVTSQLEDFGAVESDPVLQGTENYLKAHAEILQSAQQ